MGFDQRTYQHVVLYTLSVKGKRVFFIFSHFLTEYFNPVMEPVCASLCLCVCLFVTHLSGGNYWIDFDDILQE